MVPATSDPHEKIAAVGAQLRQALLSASEALKTIAEIAPSLFPQSDSSATLPSVSSTQANTQQPQSNKRKRRERDPDAPEKPLSAYHLYAKEKRDEIRASMPGTPSANDVIHEINRVWKGLSEEMKRVSPTLICPWYANKTAIS